MRGNLRKPKLHTRGSRAGIYPTRVSGVLTFVDIRRAGSIEGELVPVIEPDKTGHSYTHEGELVPVMGAELPACGYQKPLSLKAAGIGIIGI